MRFKKLAVSGLVYTFGFYVVVVWSIDFCYDKWLPRAPERATGRIHQIVVSHGSVRYASNREIQLDEITLKLRPIVLLIFFTALLLGLKWGVLHVAGTKSLKGPENAVSKRARHKVEGEDGG